MARSPKTKEETATEPALAKDAANTAETTPRAPRSGSKLAQLVEMFEAESGATIA